MEKIGILTFIRPCNYGAALQCYALNQILLQMGVDAVSLDYWPRYFRNRYYPAPVPFKWSMEGFKEWRRARKVRLIKERRNRKFEKFINNFVNISTPTAHNIDELQNYIKLSGIKKWITGSDQVWSDSCAAFDPAYFLHLELPEGASKYSYAASFGMSLIRDKLKEEYKRRLAGYRRYSVREEHGVQMIQELHNVDVKVHCDPTLLLSADDWSKVASPVRRKKYILIYHVKKADYLLTKARELSEKTGLEVVLFSPYFKYPDVASRNVRKLGYIPAMDSSPQDFVSLIKNAEYVLTNSFHGTVFSAIFHKNFWSQIQLVEGIENDRSANLLVKLGLMHRELKNQEPLKETPINWEISDQALATMRAEAIEYLKSIIEDK